MKNKIAIFSDIHGNLQALESIIKDIKEKRIDNVYCLGDVIGIGPNPKECLDLIINNNIKIEKIKLKYNRKEFKQNFDDLSYPDKEIIGKIFFEINSN